MALLSSSGRRVALSGSRAPGENWQSLGKDEWAWSKRESENAGSPGNKLRVKGFTSTQVQPLFRLIQTHNLIPLHLPNLASNRQNKGTTHHLGHFKLLDTTLNRDVFIIVMILWYWKECWKYSLQCDIVISFPVKEFSTTYYLLTTFVTIPLLTMSVLQWLYLNWLDNIWWL